MPTSTSASATDTIRALNHQHVLNTYGHGRSLALVRGTGTRVWDAEGREYLDFLSGLAVNTLGHAHPAVVEAVQRQAETLIHVSNLYYIEPQVHLARRLTEVSFADKVFFCNSGAEANEAAIKLARKWGSTAGPGGTGIVCMWQAFHGRTLATITATGQEKYQRNFHPLPGGFSHVPLNDVDALRAAITPETCAVMLEPVQAEGGVIPAEEEYLRAVRALCDERNLLLIFDEVQTGVGRCGPLWAHELAGITPDIMTVAKALGSGVPIGVMLATDETAAAMQVGDHASTFGGNALSSAAGLAVLKVVTADGFLEQARETAQYLWNELDQRIAPLPGVRTVRGRGWLIGIVADRPVADWVTVMQEEHHILVGSAGPEVLRLLPPLIATRAECDQVVAALAAVIGGTP